MREWLTDEEERREKRGAWRLKLEIGLVGVVVVLSLLIAIKDWIGL